MPFENYKENNKITSSSMHQKYQQFHKKMYFVPSILIAGEKKNCLRA